MKKRLILFLLILLNLSAIFFFSHQTGEQSGALSDGISHQLEIRTPDYAEKNQGEKNVMHATFQKFIRRMAHVILFFTLGLLAFLLLAAYPVRWYTILGGIAFGGMCALGDEVHQLFVPGRTFEWDDILHDMQGYFIGILVAGLILILCYWIKTHQKRAENS